MLVTVRLFYPIALSICFIFIGSCCGYPYESVFDQASLKSGSPTGESTAEPAGGIIGRCHGDDAECIQNLRLLFEQQRMKRAAQGENPLRHSVYSEVSEGDPAEESGIVCHRDDEDCVRKVRALKVHQTVKEASTVEEKPLSHLSYSEHHVDESADEPEIIITKRCKRIDFQCIGDLRNRLLDLELDARTTAARKKLEVSETTRDGDSDENNHREKTGNVRGEEIGASTEKNYVQYLQTHCFCPQGGCKYGHSDNKLVEYSISLSSLCFLKAATDERRLLPPAPCKVPGTQCPGVLATSPSCKQVSKKGLTDFEKVELLMGHNLGRAYIAQGDLSCRESASCQASDIMQLSWDDDLADTAQRLANTCNVKHDCKDCRTTGSEFGQIVLKAEHTFFTEYKKMLVDLFKTLVRRSPRKELFTAEYGQGPLSQLLWANTTRVGCGLLQRTLSSRKLETTLVCNYTPKGNVVGQRVYTSGPACSNCPPGTSCTNIACSKVLCTPISVQKVEEL